MDSSIKDKINFYKNFKVWYFQIREDFRFNNKEEHDARDYLSQLFSKKGEQWNLEEILISFKEIIQLKEKLLVYGCGPSLENTIDLILEKKELNFFKKFINLTADGASVLLKEKGIPIDAIFTDLDGITKNEFNYASFVIIHAHGDNIKKLKYFKDEILKSRNTIGTTQIEPVGRLINPGGFTDGDRILFFLQNIVLPLQEIFLIGMDFGNVIGKYSKLNMKSNKEADPIKLKKLEYAFKLIKWLKDKIKNKIYFVNSNFIFEDYINLSIEDFLDF
ncbi:MAG: 6-hydroxymethylpterin diphosphokinase MptE-like protein [Promethearchaeota archaeon]